MVCIIILNWNNYQDSIDCIESLKALSKKNFKIVVVDNCSTDDSFQKLMRYANTNKDIFISVYQSHKNGGYAYGNNYGINIALEDTNIHYIWILNNDTIVEPNSLESLIKKIQSDYQIGICGSTLIYEHDRRKVQAIGGMYNKWLGTSSHVLNGELYSNQLCVLHERLELDYIVGASMLVTREFINKVGLLDERYFLYCEDLDWSTRAKRNSFKIAYAPDSIVYHKEGRTTKSSSYNVINSRNITIDKIFLRSSLLYSMRFQPLHHPIMRLLFIVRAFRRLFDKEPTLAINAIYCMLFVWS